MGNQIPARCNSDRRTFSLRRFQTRGHGQRGSASGGQAVTARSKEGHFELVGLQKNEVVDVTVQYPTAKAGQTIVVTPLDGGSIIAPNKTLTIAKDGTVQFKFAAEKEPGVYQVSLREGARRSVSSFGSRMTTRRRTRE